MKLIVLSTYNCSCSELVSRRLCEVFTFPSEQRIFMKCYSVAGIYVAINVTRGVASTYIVHVHFNFRSTFRVMKKMNTVDFTSVQTERA